MNFTPSTSSGRKIIDTQIISMPGQLTGFDVIPPTTGQAIITFYDSENSTTSGKLILAEAHVDAGMPTLNHEYIRGVVANRGIYATILESVPGSSSAFIARYALG